MCGQTEVRRFAMTLMKRKSKTSPFQLPSKLEGKQFKTQNIGGPLRKDFHVQLTGLLACRWNWHAADVFLRAYIKANGRRFQHNDLATCFKIHLCTLKNQHKCIKSGFTKTQKDVEHCSENACRTRRQGVSFIYIVTKLYADRCRLLDREEKFSKHILSCGTSPLS